jgi:hypothetical protein
MINHALGYAKKGWRIFPASPNKIPIIKGWPERATNDERQIQAWFTEYPNACIAIATGKESGVWVLDIDEHKAPGTKDAFEKKYGKLPETLTQRSANGGYHFFFKWNGIEVQNSNGVIFPHVDVKSNKGATMLAPSTNPEGKPYTWINTIEPAYAPEWLSRLVAKKEEKKRVDIPQGLNTKYGEAALKSALSKLSDAIEGNRNTTLNSVAISLGHLIGGRELDQAYVESFLYEEALRIGLNANEAKNTIASGIKAGIKEPKKVTNDDNKYYFDLDEVSTSKQSKQPEAKKADSKQEVSNREAGSKQEVSRNEEIRHSSEYSLAYLIKEWIINSSGSFTVDQIDREFCLKTRTEKTNRAKCLSIYKDQNLIKKDKTLKGKWHVIDQKIEWLDLAQVEEESFPIELPFGLSSKVLIPPKAIIIIAGSSNAGKTAIMLNILHMNMNQKYEKVYLMSEMGGAEYKERIKRFEDPLVWQKNIRSASKSYDFDAVVKHHNPNGLTCIDFLEEIEGEYFKIPSSIRDIYDALGEGVAVIAIQKKSDSEYARGGEATSEKSRLYMTVDFLCALEHSIVCALKLKKVKRSINENMIMKEIHFKIERGSKLTALTDWMPCGEVKRDSAIREYQGNDCKSASAVYKFMTKEGKEVGLEPRDYEKWKEKYTAFDLDEELQRISRLSYIQAWMTRKSWFFQLGGQLDIKQKDLS